MQNARLDEAQAGNNIAGRNINSLRYPDDTTLMALLIRWPKYWSFRFNISPPVSSLHGK